MTMRKYAHLFALAFIVALSTAAVTTIRWTDIRSTDRHGNGTHGQASDNTGTSGNVAKYDANGNLTDGGVAAGNATSVNGASVPASQSCVGTNGSSQIVAGTCSGGGVTFTTSVLNTPLPSATIGTGTNKNLSITAGSTVTLFNYIGSSTVSGLPSASSNSQAIATVTDGASATDCTTGSGSTDVLCQSTGSAWTAIGSPGSSTAGYISELFIATNKYSTAVTVTVDGEGTPSINGLNICDLLGEQYCDTQPSAWNRWIAVSNDGSNNAGGALKLPIPFSSSVKVTATNNAATTATITDHIIGHIGVTQSWVYAQHLHIAQTTTSGISSNTESNMLNISPGKAGQLAGFGWIEDSFPGSASPASAPLEGAFKIYVDGNTRANYATSGSEDMFHAPWYFNNTLAFGVEAATGSNLLAPQSADISITINANSPVTWGAQRFFITDPITFTSGLKFSWTCGNTSAVSFSGTCKLISTVYYYQAP